jgi:hypothetical protein
LKVQPARFDGTLMRGIGSAIAGAAIDAISKIDLDAYRPQVKELAASLFDKYIVQVDIPGVPEMIEKVGEAAVRNAIPAIVDRFFDSLKKPGGPEAAAKAAGDAFAFLAAPVPAQ